METYLSSKEDIGSKILVSHGKLQFQAEVKDVRMCYGRKQWLVCPVAGTGEAWIDSKEGN